MLEAALAQLSEVGYAQLRLEDVATRASVAKTTVYRRWPTKADLIKDAVRIAAWHDQELPDTGSLRGDILAMLDRSLKLIGTPQGKAIARLITTEGVDPEVESVCKWMKDEARAYRVRLVKRARDRGELPEGVDGYLIMDAIFSPVFSRIIRFNEKVTRETCEALIDLVVTGAEHGGGAIQKAKPTKKRTK